LPKFGNVIKNPGKKVKIKNILSQQEKDINLFDNPAVYVSCFR
jgi:hypothetical protein